MRQLHFNKYDYMRTSAHYKQISQREEVVPGLGAKPINALVSDVDCICPSYIQTTSSCSNASFC